MKGKQPAYEIFFASLSTKKSQVFLLDQNQPDQ